jgi:hypothetical protein
MATNGHNKTSVSMLNVFMHLHKWLCYNNNNNNNNNKATAHATLAKTAANDAA